MKSWGIVKRRGDHSTLLLDFDHGRRPSARELLRTLRRVGMRPRSITYERSHSRGWHVTIKLPRRLSSGELVALQMAMGSDINREICNLFRVLCAARPRDWNLLYSRKLI